MRAVLSLAELVASTDLLGLTVGEMGTGKALLARYIHRASARAMRPFIEIDCADAVAYRSDVHLADALTQVAARAGTGAALLERARGGTLFLHHVGVLGADLQERLLSLPLEAGVALRDVRVLASRDPSDALPGGLAAAQHLVEMALPALRQRRSDIPLLAEHFLERCAARHRLGPCRIDTEAMVQLWQYDWPGNVRELERVVETVAVLNRRGVVGAVDLPPYIRNATSTLRPAAAPPGRGHGLDFTSAPPTPASASPFQSSTLPPSR